MKLPVSAMIRPRAASILISKGHDKHGTDTMKLAEKIISQFARKKADQPDAFEKRLNNLGKEAQRRARMVTPTLFVRHANAA